MEISMEGCFLKLLNMSITASWLILAVLGIRFFFRKTPKWIICLLWGAVAVRLIFPFSIESKFSLQPSAEPIKTSAIVEGDVVPFVPSIDSSLGIVENTVNPVLAEAFAYQKAEGAAPLQVFAELAGSVWLCGMLVLLLFAAVSMIKLRLCVREGVRYKENIYICDTVRSPFILGIIRPRIYLSSVLTEGEADYIIAHEKAHLRRRDNLWKPFGYLLLCLYWFNPLCWVAYIMLCKDIELACDERVIRDMSFGNKKEYSRVLLSCASQRRLVSVCPLAFGEVGVKERVKAVLNYKKPAFWITMIAVAVCVIVSICFLTNPSTEDIDVSVSVRNEEVRIASGDSGTLPELTGTADKQETKLTDSGTGLLPDSKGTQGESAENTENSVAESTMVDSSKVSEVVVTNGNTGEEITLTAESAAYQDVLRLYGELDFTAEYEENTRVGYQYRMKLLDADGNKLQSVTPYKDGVTVDDIFFQYDNTGKAAVPSLSLMEYLEAICNSKPLPMAGTIAEEPVNTLENVTMIMEKYKSYEGDIEITNQSGGELTTGEWYSIYRYEDGEWHRLDELIDGIWHEVAYSIPNGKTAVFPTNWKTWFGELPPGEYCIVKEVYLEDGFDRYYLATEFELK